MAVPYQIGGDRFVTRLTDAEGFYHGKKMGLQAAWSVVSRLALLFCCLSMPLIAQMPLSPSDVEYFESKVRPLLARKCYACHSTNTVASGELLLDTYEGPRKGGNRGPAIAPGDPEASLLVEAISYRGELKMPPDGPLTDEEIAQLRRWIERGAPDPRSNADLAGPAKRSTQALWSLQPFEKRALPAVQNPDWPSSVIDHFILAKLEDNGLEPTPPASKLTELRRVTFDLVGLPPTPEEIEAYLADDSPDAFEKVVERLLASEHYGERWARHWLDLARYAETAGHEFDQEKPDAWRYRDYVIRAFNQDLPYDQFIREQIAGDLLPSKRLTPDGTYWDSVVATGFWGLGEERNAADDLAEVRADKVDNMLDVLGKTFLGLTVGCARCHDHKFDPITMEDYYALAGVMHSSQVIQANVDSPGRLREIRRIRHEVGEVNSQIEALLRDSRGKLADDAAKYLLAALKIDDQRKTSPGEGLNPETLEAWVAFLERAKQEPDHILYPAAWLAGSNPHQPFAERVSCVLAELLEWRARAAPQSAYRQGRGDIIVEEFEGALDENWEIHGEAFAQTPSRSAPTNQPLGGYSGGGLANSFAGGADAFTGLLVSRGFRVSKPYLHVRLGGAKDETHGRQPGELRVELWSDGRFSHSTPDGSGHFTWESENLAKQPGQISFFQIVDRSTRGHIVVEQIVFSDSKEPPKIVRAPNALLIERLGQGDIDCVEDLADAYRELFHRAVERPKQDEDTRALATAVIYGQELEAASGSLLGETERRRLRQFQGERNELVGQLPASAYGMLCVDDRPRDVAIHIRGDHNNLGEVVPRRFLTALSDGRAFERGSGRLETARAVASPSNPLTTRIMVNRIWKHHFGEGLVRTPDNFGATGEAPTHPELLDTLAAMFVESGWSVKQMHRTIVLSSSYRMSSQADEKALKTDGNNRLLHHYPVRRLEAEVIRDAILSVTGTLDRAHYGPPVPPHISQYQDGRGKPPSGPLDGSGRRSIYLGVRRNFITPLLLAFDYPLSVTTIGRRSESTVPSQALVLMNNEFIRRQCEKWADRLLAEESGHQQRIESMFLRAFGRQVRDSEYAKLSRFLDEQAARYGAQPGDRRPWADLAQVLMNSKEFVFVR